MDYIDFGRWLERGAFALAALTVLLGVMGALARDRRFVRAARNSLVLGGLAVTGAAAVLVSAFFRSDYRLEYVFGYSERALDPVFKFAGLWAGLQGSILFWAMILGLIGIALAWSFRKRSLDPSGRRLEPWVYVVFAAVQCFFLAVISFVADPMAPISPDLVARMGPSGAPGGVPADGSGLTPLLENYWMLIHPPSVYIGFILYTVPFAFGTAALISGEFSSYWIRTTRRWTLVAWLFNTNGVILGGLWAYEVLGWGGYWAWDPVENASFLPWLPATAFLHSVMIQERRDMLRVWNSLLIAATFILTIFGTYLTRSGIVSSVHAFASGSVGDWFFGFLMVLIAVSIFLIFLRMNRLRSASTIDSVFSREGVFLLNNMVLVAIAAAIVLLTLWPKISNDLLGNPISLGVPVYNLVCTPFFILLLTLTAIGPSTAWVRSPTRRFVRNLALPAIVSLPLAAGTLHLAYVTIRGGDQGDPVSLAQHIYPTGIVAFVGWWIITSLAYEVWRAVSATARATGRPFVGSALRVITGNNRRYGGYLVHVGLAMLAIGVVCSSMYRVQSEVNIAPGTKQAVGPYEIEIADVQRDVPVSAYRATRMELDVTRGGSTVASLTPETRFYRQTMYRSEPVNMTIVQIHRQLSEDFYVYFQHMRPDGSALFTIFRNPLINIVWLGWLTMIAGGLFAAAPIGRGRVGLAA